MENREQWIAAGIDYDTGIRRYQGNVGMYRQLCAAFVGRAAASDLRHNLETGDCLAAFTQTHGLRVQAGNLCLTHLEQALGTLEQALRTGDLTAGQAVLPALERLWETAAAAVQPEDWAGN